MEKRCGEARGLSLVAAVRQAVPPLVGGFGSLSAADPTIDGMRVSRKRVGLAVVIGAGIAVLPEETSRKLGLALSVFGVSQAMHHLSARHRNRDGAQHGSRAG